MKTPLLYHELETLQSKVSIEKIKKYDIIFSLKKGDYT